ncbi:MAG: hypothetical protein IPH32_03650 [Bacteroidetes bacterium]|nr:hypothetical protein [Bacteroidota bacterium]
MKQVTKYIFICVFCIIALSAMAQPGSKRDKIDALRVTFISSKVPLSNQESQLFWPLYNEYNDKADNLKKSFRQQFIRDVDYSNVSDKEAEAYLVAELTLKQKEYELSKEYYEKFKKVLPIKKIALIRRAEEDFKKELIKNIKGNSSE